jgi:hypothetical protein
MLHMACAGQLHVRIADYAATAICESLKMRKAESVGCPFLKPTDTLVLFLLQVEKARMRTGFKNNLHFKSKPVFKK